MTQIIVTLDEDSMVPSIRRAIGMLRGVVSTSIYKGEDESRKKYLKESLARAVADLKSNDPHQTADDFIAEMENL